MENRDKFKRIVVKIGTSTLTHDEGTLNLRRIEHVVRILSDLKNAGKEVILVSSGAVSAGIARLGVGHRPRTTREKQAMAAVGQSELMKVYERFFETYGHAVGQLLLTKDVFENPLRHGMAQDTFGQLVSMGCVPIVNENDPISSDEIAFGGNDTLSAYVGIICQADLVVNLTDIDGLYDKDPRKFADAKLVERVCRIDDGVIAMAGGAGTERGTGGMDAKLVAAKLLSEHGIPMIILNGTDPENIYRFFDGEKIGTIFEAEEA